MKTFEIDSVPALPSLLAQLKSGEEIIFTDHDTPVARLVPTVQNSTAAPKKRAVGGVWKKYPGKFWMAADFDAPLEDFREYME